MVMWCRRRVAMWCVLFACACIGWLCHACVCVCEMAAETGDNPFVQYVAMCLKIRYVRVQRERYKHSIQSYQSIICNVLMFWCFDAELSYTYKLKNDRTKRRWVAAYESFICCCYRHRRCCRYYRSDRCCPRAVVNQKKHTLNPAHTHAYSQPVNVYRRRKADAVAFIHSPVHPMYSWCGDRARWCVHDINMQKGCPPPMVLNFIAKPVGRAITNTHSPWHRIASILIMSLACACMTPFIGVCLWCLLGGGRSPLPRRRQ